MFGRLRPPPSTPDSLERYPAKIIKDDPLSVYESTLLKLKQGSRLDISCSEAPSNTSDAMVIDQCQQLNNKSPSLLSMFSNYKKPQADNASHS